MCTTHHMPWHKECNLMTTHHFSRQFHSLMALQTALELCKDNNIETSMAYLDNYLSLHPLEVGLAVYTPDSSLFHYCEYMHFSSRCCTSVLYQCLNDHSFWGAGDGAVVEHSSPTQASHQCGPGLIPGLGVICGLSLLLVLVLAPRGSSPGTPVFPSPQKPTFPNSNSIWNSRATGLSVLSSTVKCHPR